MRVSKLNRKAKYFWCSTTALKKIDALLLLGTVGIGISGCSSVSMSTNPIAELTGEDKSVEIAPKNQFPPFEIPTGWKIVQKPKIQHYLETLMSELSTAQGRRLNSAERVQNVKREKKSKKSARTAEHFPFVLSLESAHKFGFENQLAAYLALDLAKVGDWKFETPLIQDLDAEKMNLSRAIEILFRSGFDVRGMHQAVQIRYKDVYRQDELAHLLDEETRRLIGKLPPVKNPKVTSERFVKFSEGL